MPAEELAIANAALAPPEQKGIAEAPEPASQP